MDIIFLEEKIPTFFSPVAVFILCINKTQLQVVIIFFLIIISTAVAAWRHVLLQIKTFLLFIIIWLVNVLQMYFLVWLFWKNLLAKRVPYFFFTVYSILTIFTSTTTCICMVNWYMLLVLFNISFLTKIIIDTRMQKKYISTLLV